MGKTVICPGSFDPLTIGHLDIIKRSSALFDKVIVVVMRNLSKNLGSFTTEERVDFIRRCTTDLPNNTSAIAIISAIPALSSAPNRVVPSVTIKSSPL